MAMLDRETVRAKVWGELACFTRPEAKVERVSYPVMTPSAARGVLEAIFWKPEFEWHIRRICVLRPIQFISIRRNEVQGVISEQSVKQWMQDPTQFEPYLADSMKRTVDGGYGQNRTQRNTLALRDVAYIIEAQVRLRGSRDASLFEKYRGILQRRLEKGQCYHRPYLGIREYVAYFAPPEGDETLVDDSRELGLMLLDIEHGAPAKPLFAEARLVKGVLDVDEMRRAMWSDQREAVTP